MKHNISPWIIFKIYFKWLFLLMYFAGNLVKWHLLIQNTYQFIESLLFYILKQII
jgi:hypothetical protein